MKNKFNFSITTVFFIAAIILLTVGILKKQTKTVSKNDKLKIAVSFYPLYYFVSEIGKDKVEVTNLTPAGAEPHDFEPNTRDIIKLEESKMLVVNGAGFESWIEKVSDNLKNKNVKVVAVAEGLATKDPHVWLDPILAKEVVAKITKALVEIDPQNRPLYEINSRNLEERLNALDQAFRQGLNNCRQKNIVTSHNAFGYIASRYGLEQIAIAGISPEDEPSPSKLGEIAKLAKENDIRYIFFETLLSPRLAQTIAKEVGARTLVFNPVEGLSTNEQRNGRDYFSLQEDNLKNLKIALECKN